MPSRRRWTGWLIGVLIVVAVVVAVARHAELRDLLQVARDAKPAWFAFALLLQAATYGAQGLIWVVTCRAAGARLGLLESWRMALGKLFVDQTLPSGGISGTLVVVTALRRRAIPEPVLASGLVVNMASFYAAYSIGLAAAIAILLAHGSTHGAVIAAAIVAAILGATLSAGVAALAGRAPSAMRRLSRFRLLAKPAAFLEHADASLARRPSVLGAAVLLQLAIVVLDAGTMAVLLMALRDEAPLDRIFASFMLASLFRTLGIAPGGLGTFEAASVLSLQSAGVPLHVAFAATLLFRGLSFWLPMIPGAWASRVMTKP